MSRYGSSSCSSTVIILTDYRWTLSERDAKEFVLQAPTFKKVNKRISFGIPVLVIRTPRVGNIQVYNSCLMQCHQNWGALHVCFVSVELFTEHAYSINSGPISLGKNPQMFLSMQNAHHVLLMTCGDLQIT